MFIHLCNKDHFLQTFAMAHFLDVCTIEADDFCSIQAVVKKMKTKINLLMDK